MKHPILPGRQHDARAHLRVRYRQIQEGARHGAAHTSSVSRAAATRCSGGKVRIPSTQCEWIGSQARYTRRRMAPPITSISIPPTPTSRYLALGFGGMRYQVFESRKASYENMDKSTDDGGNQIEYENEDPRIFDLYRQECAKNGVEPQMQQFLARV